MIRKISFDKQKFLENLEQDVVTRDGRKVKILEMDRPSPYCDIVAMDENGMLLELMDDGRSYTDGESDDDIFFLVDEPDKPLTDLEMKVYEAIMPALSGTSEDGSMSWATTISNDDTREITRRLVEVFKQELLPSNWQLRKILTDKKAIHPGNTSEDPYVGTWLSTLCECIGIQ